MGVCETASQVLNGMEKTNPDEKKVYEERKRGREGSHKTVCEFTS